MKTCNQKIQKPGQLCNPTTGKWIMENGATHKQLISKGLMSISGFAPIMPSAIAQKVQVSEIKLPAPILPVVRSQKVQVGDIKLPQPIPPVKNSQQSGESKTTQNKTCNSKSQKPNTICNPLTNKWILVGSATHKKLINQGVIAQSDGNIKIPIIKPTKTEVKPKTERKAPKVSATVHAPGTEMQGTDGMYIVKVRKNGAQYWAKCSFKGSNCETGQSGGMPFISALPMLSELAIPVGLGAAAYWSKNYMEKKTQ